MHTDGVEFKATKLFPVCCYVAKICRSSCGAPVRPNVLNMPKSASAEENSSRDVRKISPVLHSDCIEWLHRASSTQYIGLLLYRRLTVALALHFSLFPKTSLRL